MKIDHETIQRDLTGTRNLAIQMMQNALYIQKQLPSLEMPDDLRTRISELCDELIGTKHDLIHEIFEVSEWLESEPHWYEPWKERIRSWVFETIRSIDECVVILQEAVKNGLVSDIVPLLVMESAVNIMKTVPDFVTVSEEEESRSKSDDLENNGDQDVLEEDEDEDSYDPNCYAFYTEDSYPIGTLIAAIRKLMDRPELPDETTGNLKVFLFAMERLPLVTPGVHMSLGLRLDQGGESAWIEIRMEDGEFSLGRGTWIDGDAYTETVFEVTTDCREGAAFVAAQFAQSFMECAKDVCREVVIEDWSDGPFTGWDLKPDKKRWGSLHCSFL